MSLIQLKHFPIFGDERGSLVALEAGDDIPFDVKRVYYIFNTKREVSRGYHAHRNLKQVLIAVKGSCRIVLDNADLREDVVLNNPNTGLLIEENVWREMHDFSDDCVLLVLASEHFNESDYIRDFKTFKEEVEK